jgi:peptidoglycan lytic transglycosylase
MQMTNSIFSLLQRFVVRGVFLKQPCLVVTCFSLLLFQGCALLQGPEDITAPSETLAPTAIPKTSTAGQPAPSQLVPGQPKAKKDAAEAIKLPQTGAASWYGTDHQGKQTASGASFDPSGLTAAHPTLPFGSKIKVTNLANGKSVEVEITDRGPASGNRIIDLSQGAAKALGMIESGTANVRLELP